MLGWVVIYYDNRAQEILDALEKKHGTFLQYQTVNFWRGLNSNMPSRIIYDALHGTDSGEDVIFLIDITGAPPYRMALLLGCKHSRYEVISGITLSLTEQIMVCRETITNSALREHTAKLGAPGVSSLWHQQQKNPPSVLRHNLCEY